MGNDCVATMFTLASARARQTFPSVPGRSSIKTVNSLIIGMVGTSFTSTSSEKQDASRSEGGFDVHHTPDAVSLQHRQSGPDPMSGENPNPSCPRFPSRSGYPEPNDGTSAFPNQPHHAADARVSTSSHPIITSGQTEYLTRMRVLMEQNGYVPV